MTTPTSVQLLQQIADIQRMESGKLCVMRQGPKGPYHNLQYSDHGKPVSRYVPHDQVETVAENTLNYRKFKALVGQYAEQIVDQTRAERASDFKKKTEPKLSAWHRKKKSSS